MPEFHKTVQVSLDSIPEGLPFSGTLWGDLTRSREADALSGNSYTFGKIDQAYLSQVAFDVIAGDARYDLTKPKNKPIQEIKDDPLFYNKVLDFVEEDTKKQIQSECLIEILSFFETAFGKDAFANSLASFGSESCTDELGREERIQLLDKFGVQGFLSTSTFILSKLGQMFLSNTVNADIIFNAELTPTGKMKVNVKSSYYFMKMECFDPKDESIPKTNFLCFLRKNGELVKLQYEDDDDHFQHVLKKAQSIFLENRSDYMPIYKIHTTFENASNADINRFNETEVKIDFYDPIIHYIFENSYYQQIAHEKQLLESKRKKPVTTTTLSKPKPSLTTQFMSLFKSKERDSGVDSRMGVASPASSSVSPSSPTKLILDKTAIQESELPPSPRPVAKTI